MCLTCSRCGYDSGDFDSPADIAKKVNVDGGHMELRRDPETGKLVGWVIYCPNCGSNTDDDKIHMD